MIDNQLDNNNKNLSVGCSIYALKNQVMLDYGIYIGESYIITALEYLSKLGAFIPGFGADATIIYPAVQKYIEWKLGLKFEIEKENIYSMDTTKGWVLGFKRGVKLYMQNITDGELTQTEIDKLIPQKVVGHFHCWKKENVLESLNGKKYTLSYGNLKYAYKRDLYYYNVRRFKPADELTKKVCARTLNIAKARKEAGFKNYLVGLVELKEIIEQYK